MLLAARCFTQSISSVHRVLNRALTHDQNYAPVRVPFHKDCSGEKKKYFVIGGARKAL
jgi:hypothetical protein